MKLHGLTLVVSPDPSAEPSTACDRQQGIPQRAHVPYWLRGGAQNGLICGSANFLHFIKSAVSQPLARSLSGMRSRGAAAKPEPAKHGHEGRLMKQSLVRWINETVIHRVNETMGGRHIDEG